MTILKFRSKEQFENFVNEENKPEQPETPKAVPALTAEQVGKNTDAFISSYLAEQRKQILAARKSAVSKPQTQKAQPQNAHGRRTVRCVECKHFANDRQCVTNGWEPSHPDRTRLCWDYSPLLG